MPKKRAEVCPNCNGTNEKCKYLTTGRKCRKGNAKGKAKGKAVSDKTIEKRYKNDSLLGNLHTDYLNEMRNNQIKTVIDEETGEIFTAEKTNRTVSFERWLSLKEEKTLAMWLR